MVENAKNNLQAAEEAARNRSSIAQETLSLGLDPGTSRAMRSSRPAAAARRAG